MDLQLTGKRAFVSGSTAGIGFAIAKRLATEGATVIVNGRTEERVAEAVQQIRKDDPKAQVEGFAGDLSRPDAAEKAFQRFETIDILVNNLGTFNTKTFEELTDADWQTIIEANFMSGVRLSRYWLSRMKAAGWGRIIFILSESAVNIPVEMIHYGVTKTMQVALARGLAQTTVGTAVTVNSILPGPTRSEGVGAFLKEIAEKKGTSEVDVDKEFFATMRPGSLIKRFATPDEVASLVAYVASPLSSATNGAALRVEGGLLQSIF